MPCLHRFYDDLNLGYVTWQPNTLIIGTFNPLWNENNDADWFYGRVQSNYFWDVLPKLYDEKSLIEKKKSDWLSFCRTYGIAITDLLSTIKDADESNSTHRKLISSFSDDEIQKNFNDFGWTDISGVISRHPSIENIYFTRSATGLFGQKWLPIKAEAEKRNQTPESLLTPSGGARFKFTKEIQKNNPELALPEFILQEWKKKWHSIL